MSMKANLTPYLIFPGTCQEAMSFYRDVFDGAITIMDTFGDSPVLVPDESASRIFNSEMKSGDICLKASDDLPGHPVARGGNVCLHVVFADESTKIRVFEAFAEGGKVLFPLDDNFGMLEDKYGIRWMVEHA